MFFFDFFVKVCLGSVIVLKIPAKKSLGQNFLKDEEILKRISNTISVTKEDVILEIGPGKGALTKYLLEKNCHYFAYEIDTRMEPILSKLTSNVKYEDFLLSDLVNDFSLLTYQNFYVVANIPYYITTPIIEHLVSSGISISSMILLVQKEVADRFSAKPCTKDYGYFTVFLNYYFEVETQFLVNRTCFDPVPKVDSAVVKFIRKETKKLDEKKFFEFLKCCFSNKRKTLHNNLKQYDWNVIFPVLEKYHYSSMVRAEELPLEVFEHIFFALNL